MLRVQAPVIRQRLFSARTPEGTTLYLAFLLDNRCAIVRDEQVIEVWEDCSGEALELAIERFLALAKLAVK